MVKFFIVEGKEFGINILVSSGVLIVFNLSIGEGSILIEVIV